MDALVMAKYNHNEAKKANAVLKVAKATIAAKLTA